MHRTAREAMVVSWTKDLISAVKFFKKYPPIDVGNESKLAYVEYADSENEAMEAFKYINSLTKQQKLDLIKTQNPDLITIIPGVHIDL